MIFEKLKKIVEKETIRNGKLITYDVEGKKNYLYEEIRVKWDDNTHYSFAKSTTKHDIQYQNLIVKYKKGQVFLSDLSNSLIDDVVTLLNLEK